MAGSESKESAPVKLSKKQQLLLEQQRLVEEAAKAEAAELARQAVEDKRQQEIAAAEAAAAAKDREEEEIRIYTQYKHDCNYTERRKQLLFTSETAVNEESEWKRYLLCSPLPDISKESQLNTYLSLWNDTQPDLINPMQDFRSFIDKCHQTELVCQLLSSQAIIAREENNNNYYLSLLSSIRTLRELTKNKLDNLTSSFLSKCDEYEDKETKVTSFSHSTPTLDYALWIHSTAKAGRVKKIEWNEVNVIIELPVALQKCRTAIRMIRTQYDHISTQEEYYQQNLEEFTTNTPNPNNTIITNQTKSNSKRQLPYHFVSLGGIIKFDQLSLPTPPKQAKGWTMRDLHPPTLTYVPYPSDDATNTAPLRITLSLNKPLNLEDKEPKFGWYNANNNNWHMDGIELISFTPATGLAVLSISLLKSIAVIQPRALDFPYRAWSIDKNIFHIVNNRYDLELLLEEKGEGIKLVQPSHLTTVEPTVYQSNLPGVLLQKLFNMGIQILPTNNDAIYCRKPVKSAVLSSQLHSHMSVLVNLFDIRCVPSNTSRGRNVCLLSVRLREDGLIGVREKRIQFKSSQEREEWYHDEYHALNSVESEIEAEESGDIAEVEEENDDDMDMEFMTAAEKAKKAKEELEAKLKKEEEEKKAAAAKDQANANQNITPPPMTEEEKKLKKEENKKTLFDWIYIRASMIDLNQEQMESKLSTGTEQDTTSTATENEAKTDGEEASLNEEEEKQQIALTHAPSTTTSISPNTPPSTDSLPSSQSSTIETHGVLPESLPTPTTFLTFSLVHVNPYPESTATLINLPNQQSHSSLRRALWTYYSQLISDIYAANAIEIPKSVTEEKINEEKNNDQDANPADIPKDGLVEEVKDFAFALGLWVESPGSKENPAFLPLEKEKIYQQQTLTRLLNLVDVFTFF